MAAMMQAVAPSFKGSSPAVEKLLLDQYIFAEHVSTPLRLAASEALALLPQSSGAESMADFVLVLRTERLLRRR